MTNRLVNKFEILEDNFTVKVLLDDNYHALVDLPDWEIIKKYYWNIHKIPTRPQMYIRTVIRNNGKQSCILMHRLITGARKGTDIIHKDLNNFNNKRNNLEIISSSEHARQKTKNGNFGSNNHRTTREYHHHINNKTGCKGVSYYNGRKSPYRSSISIENKRIILGYFKTRVKAGMIYDCALKLISGIGVLNFPNLRTNPKLMSIVKKRLEKYL